MRHNRPEILIAGDLLVLALVTAYGFASHNELGSAGWRMLTTFLPLLAGWLLAALPLGALDPLRASDLRQLWRPFWAMILAGPLAACLRGVWLETPIQPVFVVVLGGVSALALLAWRLVFWMLISRLRTSWMKQP
jgi:hypothetical protein